MLAQIAILVEVPAIGQAVEQIRNVVLQLVPCPRRTRLPSALGFSGHYFLRPCLLLSVRIFEDKDFKTDSAVSSSWAEMVSSRLLRCFLWKSAAFLNNASPFGVKRTMNDRRSSLDISLLMRSSARRRCTNPETFPPDTFRFCDNCPRASPSG